MDCTRIPSCLSLVSLPALKTEYFSARPSLSIEHRVDKSICATACAIQEMGRNSSRSSAVVKTSLFLEKLISAIVMMDV